jgi:hypothetical protein
MKTVLLFLGISIGLISNGYSQNFFVSTYAGNGTQGFVNGITFNARFDRPSSICFDTVGNMYIAEWGNNCVRKITAAGIVSTLAGNGSAGFTNGTGTSATFNKPSWIDIDNSTGDLYVVDVGNECIRKVTQTGVVTTFAGTGVAGYQDGAASSAQFNALAGLAVATNGDIYVADRNNARIRKISGGIVSTVAGNGSIGFADGSALSAQFNVPADIEINSQGLIFITDRDNHRIRVFNPTTNMVSTYAGNGTSSSIDGTLSTCSFDAPRGFFINENDDIFVGDQDGNKIRMISGNNVTTIAGNGNLGYQDGPSQYAEFNLPWDVAFFQGVIFVAGDYDHSIRQIHKTYSPDAISEEEKEETTISVFPNPAKDYINLILNSNTEIKSAEIDIFSLNGQLIQSNHIGDLIKGNIITVNLKTESISTGQYILVVKSRNEAVLTRKLIIE